MSREWNIKEQAEKAKKSFDERPEWVKRISYFAGTNTVCANEQQCGWQPWCRIEGRCKRNAQGASQEKS